MDQEFCNNLCIYVMFPQNLTYSVLVAGLVSDEFGTTAISFLYKVGKNSRPKYFSLTPPFYGGVRNKRPRFNL